MLNRAMISRTSTTLWALLVWAYRRQMVQYERDRAFEWQSAESYKGAFLGRAGRTWEGRGCINGAGTLAHPDAHVLHRQVMFLKPAQQRLVIDTAASGMPPVWDVQVEPLRVVPLWKGAPGRVERVAGAVRVLGQPLRMYPGQSHPGDPRRGRHEAVGCWIGYTGHTPSEAAAIRTAARETYAFWWAALAQLHGGGWCEDAFERWKISSIGVPSEPWKADY